MKIADIIQEDSVVKTRKKREAFKKLRQSAMLLPSINDPKSVKVIQAKVKKWKKDLRS